MNERLKEIRQHFGLSTRAFAERLGMSSGAISLLETGKRSLTSQFINSVCREFNISEPWLRHGTGPMIPAFTRAQEVAMLAHELIHADDDFKTRLVAMIMKLTPDQVETIKRMAAELLEKDE